MNSKKLVFVVFGVVTSVALAYVAVPPYIQKQNSVMDEAKTEDVASEQIVDAVQQVEIESSAEPVATTTKSVPEVKEPASTPPQATPPVVVPKTPPVVIPTPPVVTPTPPVVVPPKPVSPYSKAGVATHANETSCWTIINGSVYDLTTWISQHPGGERNIKIICGKDGTGVFTAQHGGDSFPESKLKSFYLAPLAN